jgi:hypothetical protein
MLLLLQEVLGGTVRIEREAQYVTWTAIKKDLVLNLTVGKRKGALLFLKLIV